MVRVVLPTEVVPTVWWRQNCTHTRSFVSSVVALKVVYETETFWLIPFSAIAPPSVTGTIVPPEIVLPLVSTFHIATVSTAAPLSAASGLTCALNVHIPAGKVIPPGESTVQPVQEEGIDGKPVTPVFATEEPRLVPGMNAAQPV